MKVKFGDHTFEAEGNDASTAFRQWLDMIEEKSKQEILDRIDTLTTQLKIERRNLKRIDDHIAKRKQEAA